MKALAGGVAIVMIAVIVIAMNVLGSASAGELRIEKPADEVPLEAEQVESQPVTICVHIGGCVVSPGVVRLDEGARVADGIAAAGGLTEDAAPESVNLARTLQDGEQVIVPSKEEAAAAQAVSQAEGTAVAESPASVSGGKVNLNTATVADLMTLNGIGESKAKKIISYRESNGPFATVDDLTNVSGIGDKTLESLRDIICV